VTAEMGGDSSGLPPACLPLYIFVCSYVHAFGFMEVCNFIRIKI
jgi:hypothetical protein